MALFRDFKHDPKQRKLIIPGYIWSDMNDAMTICNGEVGAVGLLEVMPIGCVVRHLYFLKQRVGSSHTEIDMEALGMLQTKLFHSGTINIGDKKTFLRFHWHSHVDMPAAPSPPDEAQYAKIGGNCSFFDPEWFITMISNRAGDWQTIIHVYRPIRGTIDITEHTIVGDHRITRPDLMIDLGTNLIEAPQETVGGRPVNAKR